MKYIIILLMAVLAFSCEPRIEMDMTQWGDTAFLVNVQVYKLTYDDEVKLEEWYRDTTATVTGVFWTAISEGNAVIDNTNFTATVSIADDESLENAIIRFSHTAYKIEPLNGAPVAGLINDFSEKEFVYRVYSADDTYHDWTIYLE